MTKTYTDTIPIARAMVCLNCEALRGPGLPECPRCGSRSVWPLAKWFAESSGKRVKRG